MGQIRADRRPQSPKPTRVSLFPLILSIQTGALLTATAAARQPFAYMLPAIWQTAWRKRRLQRRRYNAHVSLIRHETSRRVFERRYNDRGRRKRQSKGANISWDREKRKRHTFPRYRMFSETTLSYIVS